MFDRLFKIIQAFFDKGISKMETPEILAEQAQEQLESTVKKVRETVISAVANEKMLEGKIKKNAEELSLWERRAAAAVQQNDDELAKQCLQKKQELNQNAFSLQSQLAEQQKTTISLKERANELDEKLREFRNKKKDLSTRVQASESVNKAHDLLSSSTGSSMDKWEEKIREKESRSEAVREMSAAPVEDKFKQLDKNMQLDDELAALKAKMGGGPKLIVDQESSQKPVVDQNVPMVIDNIEDAVEVEEVKPGDEKGK
jgi:phage shock protein A